MKINFKRISAIILSFLVISMGLGYLIKKNDNKPIQNQITINEETKKLQNQNDLLLNEMNNEDYDKIDYTKLGC